MKNILTNKWFKFSLVPDYLPVVGLLGWELVVVDPGAGDFRYLHHKESTLGVLEKERRRETNQNG